MKLGDIMREITLGFLCAPKSCHIRQLLCLTTEKRHATDLRSNLRGRLSRPKPYG